MASSIDLSGFDEGWSSAQISVWLNKEINRIAEPIDMFMAGKRLYRDGLYCGAAKLLQNYCDSGSAESPGYHLLGYAYYMSGETPKSIPYLRKAVCQGFDADWQLLIEMVLTKDEEKANDEKSQRGAAMVMKPVVLSDTTDLGPQFIGMDTPPLATPPLSIRSVAGSPARSERSARVLSPSSPSNREESLPPASLTVADGEDLTGFSVEPEGEGDGEGILEQGGLEGAMLRTGNVVPALDASLQLALDEKAPNLVDEELARAAEEGASERAPLPELSHMKSRIEIDGVVAESKAS